MNGGTLAPGARPAPSVLSVASKPALVSPDHHWTGIMCVFLGPHEARGRREKVAPADVPAEFFLLGPEPRGWGGFVCSWGSLEWTPPSSHTQVAGTVFLYGLTVVTVASCVCPLQSCPVLKQEGGRCVAPEHVESTVPSKS